MTKNHQKLCSELFPLYETWKSAVLDAKKAMKDFASAEDEEEIKQARENFQKAKQKAEQAKQDYDNKAYERVEFEEIEVVYKDALLLLSLKEKIGKFNWSEENGIVNYIDASDKDFSSFGVVYFPDNLQKLWLNNATIKNPENLKFPETLKELFIQNIIIENTKGLKIPDNLTLLNLIGSNIINPENLKLPENLRTLWLDHSTTEKLENLNLPENLKFLTVIGIKINKAFRKKLKDHQERNLGLEIFWN
jgi:hypothetical protein